MYDDNDDDLVVGCSGSCLGQSQPFWAEFSALVLHPPASIVTVVMMMMVMEEVVTMMKVSMVKIVKRMLLDHMAVPKHSAITNWMINADLQMTKQSSSGWTINTNH